MISIPTISTGSSTCGRSSQQAFERTLNAGADGSTPSGPTTGDYLEALRSTRTTVSPQVAAEFLEDIERLARL